MLLLPGQTQVFPEKPCAHCSRPFQPLSGTSLYCTENCKKAAQRKRKRERDFRVQEERLRSEIKRDVELLARDLPVDYKD